MSKKTTITIEYDYGIDIITLQALLSAIAAQTDEDGYDYDVSTFYLTALLYGELTGIECSEEEKRVVAFMEDIGLGIIEVISEESFFDRCDVSGLMSDCYHIKVHYFEK